MREYSNRLGQISDEQFQAALQRFGLGDFVCAEPVSFGLFGQNVFVTSTQGEFVLRGVPHYPWQFPTERFFADKLHEYTRVPVPHPYLFEPSTDIFGWSFVIMPRLPGLQMQDEKVTSALPFADRVEVARALAQTLVEAQSYRWEQAGLYDMDAGRIKPFEQHYRAWVVEHIHEKLAASRSYNDHTTDSDVRWAQSIIEHVQPVLDLPYQPSIVFGDYGEHNTVVMRAETGWRVSGVFDLMTTHVGDGQADLSLPVTNYLKHDKRLADAFVGEYWRLKAPQSGFVEHQRLYMLDLTLSFWRYWQNHEGGIPGERRELSFEQWARPCVDYWASFRLR